MKKDKNMRTVKMMMRTLLICLLACGCSSDDDGNKLGGEQPEPENPRLAEPTPVDEPNWFVDFSCPGAEVDVPDWKDPPYNLYELNMTAILMIPVSLYTCESEGDLMAAFINGECRGVTTMTATNVFNVYPLFIRSNAEDPKEVTIKYYSKKCKQVFVVENAFPFYADVALGAGQPMELYELLLGGPKYKVAQTNVVVKLDLPFEPEDDDKIAAMVDGECRGVYLTGSEIAYFFDIMALNANEKYYFEYYRKKNHGLYRSMETFSIEPGEGRSLDVTMMPVVKK